MGGWRWEGESLRMDRRNNVRGREQVCMRGGGRGGRGGGQERGRGRWIGRQRVEISDEIGATIIDHVIVHGLTMRDAGLRVTPQFEPIFCVHHSKDIQRRKQVQYATVFL